jgi:hypothetical protein
MWDLWWTKWHWDRFFSESFGFLLSVAFHWCPMFILISSWGWTMDPSEAQFQWYNLIPFHQYNIAISKQLGVWVTSQFWETDIDSTANRKRIWLWTWLHDLNRYLEIKPEVNVFRKAWPILAPRPLRAARKGRSRVKLCAHSWKKET